MVNWLKSSIMRHKQIVKKYIIIRVMSTNPLTSAEGSDLHPPEVWYPIYVQDEI